MEALLQSSATIVEKELNIYEKNKKVSTRFVAVKTALLTYWHPETYVLRANAIRVQMAELEVVASKHSLLLKGAVASAVEDLGAKDVQALTAELTAIRSVEGNVLEHAPFVVLFDTNCGRAIYSLDMNLSEVDFSDKETTWLLHVIPVAHMATVAWRVIRVERCSHEGWRAVANRRKKTSASTEVGEVKRRNRHRRSW